MLIPPHTGDDSSEANVNSLQIIDGRLLESTLKCSKKYHSLINAHVATDTIDRDVSFSRLTSDEKLIFRDLVETKCIVSARTIDSEENASIESDADSEVDISSGVPDNIVSTNAAVVIGCTVGQHKDLEDSCRLTSQRELTSPEETTQLGMFFNQKMDDE